MDSTHVRLATLAPPASTRRRRSALAIGVVAVALGAGCAGSQKKGEPVVWPPAPELARVKYVRSFSGTADFEASAWSRFWRSISGAKHFGVFNPTALALSQDERRLYVTCAAVGRVVEFDLVAGKVRLAANAAGYKAKSPFGVAVDGDGNVYVTDQVEKLVWVYKPDGSFLRRIGKDMFLRPVGIAIDRKRQLVYVVEGGKVDSDRHRVEVFAPDGKHLRTIGKRGGAPGEFNFPTYAAVSPDGNLLVADTGNFRIQTFSPTGSFLGVFGAQGYGPASFGMVKGLAFDGFGNLYAVDGQVGLVQMFNSSNQALMFFGGAAPRPEFMHLPNGIAIDSKNNIYVADYGFNHVNQYVLVNTTAADSHKRVAPAPTPPPTSAPKGR